MPWVSSFALLGVLFGLSLCAGGKTCAGGWGLLRMGQAGPEVWTFSSEAMAKLAFVQTPEELGRKKSSFCSS